MSFYLRVEHGYNRGAHYPLPEGTAYVGRDETATVRLLADGVSRRHAQLTTTPEGVSLVDLDSKNGCYVNGVRCTAPRALSPGDQLRFGDVSTSLQRGEASSEPGSTVALDTAARSDAPSQEAPPQIPAPQVQLWGDSPPIRTLLEHVERVAAVGCAVLVRGETGTGKELVARAIHALSPRRQAPFVVINCSSLEGSLLESELFGHERGAFTGAVARKLGLVETAGEGVLFLDEVGELPLPAQAKLLRLLENREYRRVGGVSPLESRCQVVAATNRDLEAAIASGAFREDLLYRLQVVELTVPPLRERGEDLPLLIERFFAQLCVEVGRRLTLSPGARDALLAWRWPGNVRELKNALERCVILAPGPEVLRSDLPQALRREGAPAGSDPAAFRTLGEVEREHIRRAMTCSDGHRGRAAELLGIDRKTLYRKLKAYELGDA